ncbi:hypothetical protein COO60DRAFT_530842 [Scenedesmus sp. NREL 46B-D3]|nr:hypothetical protein COO60DRAFT_530842 [Scenedesmus sp. NREL 46B-D3]
MTASNPAGLVTSSSGAYPARPATYYPSSGSGSMQGMDGMQGAGAASAPMEGSTASSTTGGTTPVASAQGSTVTTGSGSSSADGSSAMSGATTVPAGASPSYSSGTAARVQPGGGSVSVVAGLQPSGSGAPAGNAKRGLAGTTPVVAPAGIPAATDAVALSTGPGKALAAAVPAAALQPVEYPGNIVGVPAITFYTGYCVPRQAFVTVNITALACNPGSNLTQWDGQDVCARIDCEAKLTRSNLIYAPAFCRTVVEPARLICPQGCQLVTQTLRNATSNATRRVPRCACRAGNQPCPGTYFGCVCQPAWIPTLNSTSSYVLCAAQQGACNTNCLLTANALGPLCPIVRDSTIPIDPAFTGPIYPGWAWDLAQQGQATAAVAPGAPGAPGAPQTGTGTGTPTGGTGGGTIPTTPPVTAPTPAPPATTPVGATPPTAQPPGAGRRLLQFLQLRRWQQPADGSSSKVVLHIAGWQPSLASRSTEVLQQAQQELHAVWHAWVHTHRGAETATSREPLT